MSAKRPRETAEATEPTAPVLPEVAVEHREHMLAFLSTVLWRHHVTHENNWDIDMFSEGEEKRTLDITGCKTYEDFDEKSKRGAELMIKLLRLTDEEKAAMHYELSGPLLCK